ncbi:MAG TPA: hypothetical protein VMD05_07495 [Candidatus Nanoarchaeia archaeon]|nr:hypothetical protein [Candidatus Nanoarchaeia archaeon]
MNWKAVLDLIRIDVKSARMLRGQRLQKYNVGRNPLSGYGIYVAAAVIGAIIGSVVAWFYEGQASNNNFKAIFTLGFASFQVSLPLIIVLVTLIFMIMAQLQRGGVSFTRQAPYWLPVTWQEHTLASIVADVLGIPMVSLAAITPAVLIVSVFTGQFVLAIGGVVTMFAAAFTAGATAEIIRILQTRFTGAVYKSTGKAAVWVRFAGTIIFFIIFYIIYFYIIYGTGLVSLISSVASIQNSVWFVPFVWLGLTLYSFLHGLLLEGFAFLGLSILFILGLYYLAVSLNIRFGLYEPPAIKVSRGTYAPKTGTLGKLGFSNVESAIIRKDFKAFTRRRELMSAFIPIIVFVLIPIMSSIGSSGTSSGGFPPQLGLAFSSILPVGILAMTLGNFMTGEEGQSIWRIYISPVSAKAFVKSKLAFMLIFTFIVLPITLVIGYFIYHPTPHTLITMVAESVFVAFALGTLSLANGIKGADFNETPRPRMIRVDWSFINLAACFVAGLALIIPLAPYLVVYAGFISGPPIIGLFPGIIISGVIAAVMTAAFYTIAINNAKKLIAQAEI